MQTPGKATGPVEQADETLVVHHAERDRGDDRGQPRIRDCAARGAERGPGREADPRRQETNDPVWRHRLEGRTPLPNTTPGGSTWDPPAPGRSACSARGCDRLLPGPTW